MFQTHPFILLAAWMLGVIVNSLLMPVYFGSMGPLGGGIIFMLAIALLGGGGIIVLIAGIVRARQANHLIVGVGTFVLVPMIIMSAGALLLTGALAELSWTMLHGPR